MNVSHALRIAMKVFTLIHNNKDMSETEILKDRIESLQAALVAKEETHKIEICKLIEIDLNDTVSVELTEWGATYLNATNAFKKIATPQKCHYKTDYKAGDVYKNQLWQLILEFKDGMRFDKEKAFKKLTKVID